MGYVNYTMTEAEAMQTARENTTYIEQLGYLIQSMVEEGKSFYEARAAAIERADEEGDDFRERPQSQEKYSLKEYLTYCFPELSETALQSLLKWENKRAKKTKKQGKNFFKIFGKAQQLTNRAVSRPSGDREEFPEAWKNHDAAFLAFFRMVERDAPVCSNAMVARTFNRGSSSRARRPVRAATSSSSGDDGESDQGEPPRPPLTVPSLHSFPSYQKLNSFSPSWIFPPNRWSMSGRWQA